MSAVAMQKNLMDMLSSDAMVYFTVTMYLREVQFRVPDNHPPADGQIEAPNEINKAVTIVLAEQSFFLSET
jgi:hypothetical protein